MNIKCTLQLVILSIFLLPVAEAADTSADALAKAWQQRAELAKKKLAGPGLDDCDKGLEQAFASALEMPRSGSQRAFALNIKVAGQTLQAAYFYNDTQLTDFMLVSLPQTWLAKQKAGSRTLSILVRNSNCALDLCTDDPLATGACAQGAR